MNNKRKCEYAMKRLTVAVLIALTALCLFGSFALAEAPDETAVLAFNHEVYEANQLDALFNRHESVAYAFTFPDYPELDWRVWETRDSSYREYGNGMATFERDRIVYSMDCDEETGALSLVGGVDFDLDYDPFYSYVGYSEEDFYDPEHDHVMGFYEEDGLIYLSTRFDETLSRKYVETFLGLEYDGQIIDTEIVADAGTHEIVAGRETMEWNGEETVACAITVEYDAPEPIACRTLRAGFERNGEKSMTVTFFVDHGTDRAFVREYTVPANMEAGNLFGDVPFVYSYDPECETIYHWDRNSDISIYVFTNPDDALVEKFQTLMSEFKRSTQAAAPDAETFKALVAANAMDQVLARHANCEIDISCQKDGETLFSSYDYRDADTCLLRYSDGHVYIDQADLCVERYADDQGFDYTETIFDTPEASQASFEAVRDTEIIIIPEAERLVETIDAGDGLFVAVTEISDPEFLKELMPELFPEGTYAYADGIALRCQYTFDAETEDLLGIDTFLIDAKGESNICMKHTYAFDVADYDPAAEGEPFAAYCAGAKDPEKTRTVTIVFAPDTDNEHDIARVQPRGTHCVVRLDGESVEHLYTDRECTQEYEYSADDGDLTLYVK